MARYVRDRKRAAAAVTAVTGDGGDGGRGGVRRCTAGESEVVERERERERRPEEVRATSARE